MPSKPVKIKVRRARLQDKPSVVLMLRKTNHFRPNELKVAEEVFDDSIAKGQKGDYHSFVAQEKDNTIGWVCFGPTPCTIGTFDIYWIVVNPQNQNCGIGSFLVQYATSFIKKRNGRMIVVDTSGNQRYLLVRRFYEKMGYCRAARLKDFYANGDDKIIYVKYIERARSS